MLQYTLKFNNLKVLKEKVEFVIKLLPYANPKYLYKNYNKDIADSTLFSGMHILNTVDEKKRMDKVRAYEEKNRVEIL